jgi:hypothetical protein
MKTLSKQDISKVSGGALGDDLGLFPKTGIKLIDDIHKMEWKLYGKPLYNTFAFFFGLKKV